MTHPVQLRVARAKWWREHLRERCRPGLAKPKRRVLVAEVQKVVAAYYRMTIPELLERKNSLAIVRPRQIAMFLARRFTERSFPFLADHFKMADHTSVVGACQKIEQLMLVDDELRADVEELARRIANAG